MDDQKFSDGIGAISVIGGTVRLDLVALSPTERDSSGQPKAMFQQRIVMTMEGFLRSAGKVQEAAQALAKLGVKLGEGPAVASLTTAEPTIKGAAPVGVSQSREGSKPPFP